MKKTTGLILLVALITVNVSAQVDKAINKFVNDSVFAHAGISICIRDIESGEILLGHNADMALTTASVMKLVTTGSVLELLGPDYKYITRVGYAGTVSNNTLDGNIIIKGSGDPSLGSEYFPAYQIDNISKWAESIKDAGIKKINGRVIADASIFRSHPIASGWPWGDIGNYYGAGVYGISFKDNMFRLYFRTGKEGSKPEIIEQQPVIQDLTIENHLTAYGNRDRGYVYSNPYGSNSIIRGSIPIERDSFVLKAAIPDPPKLVANLLHNKLLEIGIEISNKPVCLKDNIVLLDNKLLSKIVITSGSVSPELKDIINITNLQSVNLFAETLVWTLDYEISGKENAYLSNGLKIIENYLKSNRINTSGLYMTDGSGLSRSNAMTTTFITSYLAFMSTESKYGSIFLKSLAIPGEGTLEPYFHKPIFKDNLQAKSGTMTRVRNYAGFLRTSSGRHLSFGVFTNNFDCSSHQVTKRVEKLMEEVFYRY